MIKTILFWLVITFIAIVILILIAYIITRVVSLAHYRTREEYDERRIKRRRYFETQPTEKEN